MHEASCHFGGIQVCSVLVEAMAGVEPYGLQTLYDSIAELVNYFLYTARAQLINKQGLLVHSPKQSLLTCCV